MNQTVKESQQVSTSSDSVDVEKSASTKKPCSPKQSNHQFESNRKYFTICVYALFVILIGSFFIYCIINLDKTKSVITRTISHFSPFIIAFFISYILNPIVVRIRHFFEHVCKIKSQKISNILSIILTYILAFGLIAITLIYIIPELGKSISELSTKFQTLGEEFLKAFNRLEDLYPSLGLASYEDKINELMLQLVSFGPNMVKSLIPAVFSFSVNVVKLVINLLLSIVISIYMLSDKKMISRSMIRALYAFFRQDKVDTFLQNVKECNVIFSNFIIGKSLDSLIIGVICFILMTILRLPYSVLLSLIVGITNMIPYFGPFIGAVPGVILFLVIDPIKAIIFTIMILALQQFDGLILGPKILGSSTGLKPLWVIFAITIGGAYAGILGMFLGVPVVAVFFYLFNKAVATRLKKKNLFFD